jgi:hypothetical protein
MGSLFKGLGPGASVTEPPRLPQRFLRLGLARRVGATEKAAPVPVSAIMPTPTISNFKRHPLFGEASARPPCAKTSSENTRAIAGSVGSAATSRFVICRICDAASLHPLRDEIESHCRDQQRNRKADQYDMLCMLGEEDGLEIEKDLRSS